MSANYTGRYIDKLQFEQQYILSLPMLLFKERVYTDCQQLHKPYND